MEKLPNFLIAGAAKAGTTAIATYLEQHPQIYLSPMKEPKFFSSQFIKFPYRGPGDDFVENFTVKTMSSYQRLFRWVRREKAIGEASVENLYYYQSAIPLIKSYLGDPKIIIVLRNPVDRAFSAYKMMVRDGREVLSFEEALEAEADRMMKNWEYLWYYLQCGFYASQVQAYFQSFTNVKIVLFDDLRLNAVSCMQNIYSFLEVRESFYPKISLKVNASGRMRSALWRLIFRASGFKGMLYKFLSLSGISDSTILSVIESVREGDLEPMEMKEETRRMLQNYYREDIMKLSKIIGRDLKGWLDDKEENGTSERTTIVKYGDESKPLPSVAA
ncbi:MAG: sulfotransferase [Chitinivibrionales bacterium]|nr:sulfotransferase [Chitinivibrionales bacterium]